MEDAGSSVTGVGDAGSSVTGVEDAGSSVTGVEDAGSSVTGVGDAGSSVAGVGDAGSSVAGVGDAGSSVTGVGGAGSWSPSGDAISASSARKSSASAATDIITPRDSTRVQKQEFTEIGMQVRRALALQPHP